MAIERERSIEENSSQHPYCCCLPAAGHDPPHTLRLINEMVAASQFTTEGCTGQYKLHSSRNKCQYRIKFIFSPLCRIGSRAPVKAQSMASLHAVRLHLDVVWRPGQLHDLTGCTGWLVSNRRFKRAWKVNGWRSDEVVSRLGVGLSWQLVRKK